MFQGRSTARASYGQYVGGKQSQVRIVLTQVDSQVQLWSLRQVVGGCRRVPFCLLQM